MRPLILALMFGALLPSAMPAVAQSRGDEARFDAAQARFDREVAAYQAEVRRYRDARAAGYQGAPPPAYGRSDGGYRVAPDRQGYADDRDEQGYDPARQYRDGPNYRPRTLAADDRVYRGSDGRYYCQRGDGTTGLILGAAGGGILGNVIDGGHSRTVGTLIGGALGALAGRSIEQQQSVQCQ